MGAPINLDSDLLDLRGKVAIVTGGNTGIGYWTTAHLSKRGAKVYMASRNESKAKDAISRIEAWNTASDRGPAIYHHLDLSDPREAKQSAEAFLAQETRLDILINNAGMLAGPYEETKEGIVNTMVVNHISPFVFTNTLSPLLEKTAKEPNSDVRIIIVSSLIHSVIRDAKFDSIASFNTTYENAWFPSPDMKRYALSKLANLAWMKELQQRYKQRGVPITCIAIHPGGVLTDTALEGLRKSRFPSLRIRLSRLFADEPEQGSFTTLFAAASKAVAQNPEKYCGQYLAPYGKIATPSALARDPKLASTLWTTTEKILRDVYGVQC
ncbi:NAD-P-binding protein [Panus rudis PR-1116 ss-1]|nr:NAD-P-binding protein [Panus rudis PR-1116 ss-1]